MGWEKLDAARAPPIIPSTRVCAATKSRNINLFKIVVAVLKFRAP
jgi:hypothetical protein